MEPLFDTTAATRKIRKAFDALRREGVNARMNYMCCNTCAMETAPFFSSLVYYPREDAIAFRESGVLFIRFLSSDGDKAGTRALGDQVRCILELNGLEVEWDGSPGQAIMVMA
jgi:hypothetical protein